MKVCLGSCFFASLHAHIILYGLLFPPANVPLSIVFHLFLAVTTWIYLQNGRLHYDLKSSVV